LAATAPASGHFKDEILDRLAGHANVAQFVSFGPDLRQRYARVQGFEPNHVFASPADAIAQLLERAPDGAVNVRSYQPDQPKSREFLYGRSDVATVRGDVERLAGDGLYTIINETIDVHDGGVSGVAFGEVVEFAPDDTPRCVEKGGTAALPRSIAWRLLETVYGFAPAVQDAVEARIEFSVHPLRRGYRHEHTIVWEMERPGEPPSAADVRWPNRFSRHIGDKAYGLLIADALELPVPATTVLARRVAPFGFGRPTGSHERWIRTCPIEQVPGRFTTRRGWIDPFTLLQTEDPQHTAIASVLAQHGVDAAYSGALIVQEDGAPLLEGVAGRGDDFMQGGAPTEALPAAVRRDVLSLWRRATDALGAVRFEWVHDGREAWLVQLHRGATATRGDVIVPGEADEYHELDVRLGIDALRTLIDRVGASGSGIALVGSVGLTSHFGDLLRRAGIPSIIRQP
jgi:hypothetical protein